MDFKKTRIAATLAVLVTAISFGNTQAHASSNTLIVDDNHAQCPNASYTSIQAAVIAAAPGDTVKVCAGMYNESVTVSKPLTILGAQAGKDARQGRNNESKESIVNGPEGGFNISGGGITIDGFILENASGVGGNARGIFMQGGTNYTILDNIFRNNSSGSYFWGDTILFRHNYFDSNNNAPNGDGLSGLFACCGASNNVTIDENGFTGHLSGAIVFVPSSANNINIINNDSVNDANFAVMFTSNNVTISNNRVSYNGDPANVGSAIYISSNSIGGNNNVLVRDNRITGGDATGVNVNTAFGGPPSTGVHVVNNDIRDRRYGVRVLDSQNGVEVRDNKITNSSIDGIYLGPDTSSNTLTNNSIKRSAEFDARDDSHGGGTAGTANTWTNNKCDTSSPAGLCGR